MKWKILLLLGGIIFSLSSISQETVDSNYIHVLTEKLHLRTFTSNKYTNVVVSTNGTNSIEYEPNSTTTFGVGATVRSFSLNIAYGFRFLNAEEGKGKTNHFDLQANLYKRKYVMDIFVQLYEGFCLNNTNALNENYTLPFYLRPDLNARLYGVSYLHVFNSDKFSYAAPFVQNEIQEKSAGSFLLGGKMFYNSVATDSSLVPSFTQDSIYGVISNVQQFKAFQVGPTVGYAYSLVAKKHLFLIGSLDLSFMTGPVRFNSLDGKEDEQWQVNPVIGARLGLGYNSPGWFLGLTFLQEGTTLKGVDKLGEINISGGSVRLNYVKRFEMSKKFKTLLAKLPL